MRNLFSSTFPLYFFFWSLVCVTLFSCQRLSQEEKWLVNTWKLVKVEQPDENGIYHEIKLPKTFSASLRLTSRHRFELLEEDHIVDESGKWSLKGDTLTLHFSPDNFMPYIIEKISEDELVWLQIDHSRVFLVPAKKARSYRK